MIEHCNTCVFWSHRRPTTDTLQPKLGGVGRCKRFWPLQTETHRLFRHANETCEHHERRQDPCP